MSSVPRKPNRSWVWFFVLLAAAGAGAVAAPLVYNLRQQLRPEQLEAARARWQENGPADYDLAWEVKQDTGTRRDEYLVVVRDRKVWMVKANREVWLARELATPLGGAVGATLGAAAAERPPQRELTGYTVEAMFREMEDDLNKNAAGGRKGFTAASFDSRDGHPVRYTHRAKQWHIKLVRP
jgi:hypothetical protein